MPRRARTDTPGALHHIICRGIERIRIFRDNRDRDNFVDSVLEEAQEALDRKDQYCMAGIGFDEVLQSVAEIFNLEAQEIMAAGKQPLRVQARSLLCYWAVRELGYSVTPVANKLGLGQPAVSRAVQRGERIAQKMHPSCEVGRFEINNLSPSPYDFRRSASKNM